MNQGLGKRATSSFSSSIQEGKKNHRITAEGGGKATNGEEKKRDEKDHPHLTREGTFTVKRMTKGVFSLVAHRREEGSCSTARSVTKRKEGRHPVSRKKERKE